MGEGKKENRVRREFSSGGCVYKRSLANFVGKKDKWLITRSAPSEIYPKSVWRLPKGWIDKDESAEETALREVEEEGGVEAKVIKKIETVSYFFTTPDESKVLKFVSFYLMEWTKNLSEGFGEETSEIAWLPFDQAVKRLTYSGEKQILKKAKELLV